ncbi:DMT family transporter [Hydrogenophaga sp. ANAO-22]|jgi:drug/metabolite transporter (DMT)-like permease|uniref:DMT family transporter n=2 Tax=Bacteria TaxID=2 RepID=UPI0036D3CB38
MKYRSLGMRLTIIFVALWAAEEALTGVLLQRYGLAQVVCLRFALHLALLWMLFGRDNGPSLWRTRRPVSQLFRAAMMVGMPACWSLGVQRGLAPVTFLAVFWIAPLMILGLSRLVLRERVPLRLFGFAAAASVGVFLLLGPHALPRPELLVFPVAMAACFSVYVVMTRLLHAEPTRVNLFYTGLGACLLLLPLMPSGWVTPSAPDLLLLAGVAVLGLGALLALERLTAVAPISRTAPLLYLQIGFTLAFAWVASHPLPGLIAVGAVLLAAGLWLALRQRRRGSSWHMTSLLADTGHAGLD